MIFLMQSPYLSFCIYHKIAVEVPFDQTKNGLQDEDSRSYQPGQAVWSTWTSWDNIPNAEEKVKKTFPLLKIYLPTQ